MAIIEIDIQRDLSTEQSDHEWRDQANCKGDTRLFFPPKAERRRILSKTCRWRPSWPAFFRPIGRQVFATDCANWEST